MMLEKGILDAYQEIIMDMSTTGEQRSWRHLKRNSWGETPVLELLDGTMISEASAIARYLDDSHSGRKIMGEGPVERALDQMWDNRIWTHLVYRFTVAFHVQVSLKRHFHPGRLVYNWGCL